jgi:methylglutaconyl-CoA hydratase
MENIEVTIANKIATITFSNTAGNSFSSTMLRQLTQLLNQLSSDENVTIIILQSQGKTFCAGASFDELLQIEDFESGKNFFSGFANVINAMRTCSKIIVGKIQGKAVGGGVGLISACDYALATNEAAVKLSEIAIGIGPFVIEPAVSRKIGATAMAELALQPTEWKDAQWAKEKGLFSQLVNSQEILETETVAFAEKLANYNPEALTQMKKIFWQNTENWNELLYERAAISGKLVLSNFTKNALNQFKK